MRENQKTANSYTGKLPFKHKLVSWEDRDSSYPHANWVTGTKKKWRDHASHLNKLIVNTESSSKWINLDEDGVGSNVVLKTLQALMYVGKDDKSNVLVGCHMPLAATALQYSSVMIPSQKQSSGISQLYKSQCCTIYYIDN